MITFLKNPIIIWIIAIVFLLIGGYFAYKHFTTKDLTAIEQQLNTLKVDYDNTIKTRESEKKVYTTEMSKLKKKYSVLDVEHKKTLAELEVYKNAKPPESKKERMDRLTALGLSPTSN